MAIGSKGTDMPEVPQRLLKYLFALSPTGKLREGDVRSFYAGRGDGVRVNHWLIQPGLCEWYDDGNSPRLRGLRITAKGREVARELFQVC